MVPQPGGAVLVVNGLYRGAKGSLVGIDTKRFQVWRLTAYCCFTPLVSAAAAAESSHSLHCITFDASLNYLPACLPCCASPGPTPQVQAEVKLRGGAHDGQAVWLEYEDFSRWHGTFK